MQHYQTITALVWYAAFSVSTCFEPDALLVTGHGAEWSHTPALLIRDDSWSPMYDSVQTRSFETLQQQLQQ